jgi:hypothetical protein
MLVHCNGCCPKPIAKNVCESRAVDDPLQLLQMLGLTAPVQASFVDAYVADECVVPDCVFVSIIFHMFRVRNGTLAAIWLLALVWLSRLLRSL